MPTTWAGVLPSPKITSGKFFRKERCRSTLAKPRSASGADWKACKTFSLLISPARNFSSSPIASIAVTRAEWHGLAERSRMKWKRHHLRAHRSLHLSNLDVFSSSMPAFAPLSQTLSETLRASHARPLVHGEPIVMNDFDDFDEGLETHWFYQIGIGPVLVSPV